MRDLSAALAHARDLVAGKRDELHIPGLVFVVVDGDQVAMLETIGLRDREHGLPVTADTLFPIGSCTKSFTSMALAIAQDEGLLTLDDSPHRFLPYLHLADPEANELVTLRDMLSHRTGLKANADLAAEPGVLTREEYVRAATSATPTARLREKFQYSNAMFAAAGEILGRVYRSTWEDVIATHVFGPLGMAASTTRLEELSTSANHATGYVYVPASASWRPTSPPRSLAALAPAGSISSSATDIARWLRLLTNGGSLDGKTVVSEAGLKELTTPHMAIKRDLSYGLGWALYEWNGHRIVEHNGGSEGLSALISVMPDRKVGFALLANASPSSLTTIGNAGALLWPLLTGEPAPMPTKEGPPAASTPVPLPALAPAIGMLDGAPSLDVLLARMTTAAGGERNLRRHGFMETRGTKHYDNQGVQASVVNRRQAPDLVSDCESWVAAEREIGTFRTYFDGEHGGQETTFGQDASFSGEELANLRRDAARGLPLDLLRMYTRLSITARVEVANEAAYVLEAATATGPPDLYYVSARTGLILERHRGHDVIRFGDFRNVDGEVMPFHIVAQDALGEATTTVDSVRFKPAAPSGAKFGPRAAGTITDACAW